MHSDPEHSWQYVILSNFFINIYDLCAQHCASVDIAILIYPLINPLGIYNYFSFLTNKGPEV